MLEQVKQAAEIIKGSEVIRQITALLTGAVFIIFLYVNTNIELPEKLIKLTLNNTQLGFIFLSIAYISGKLLLLISNIVSEILGFITKFFSFILEPIPIKMRFNSFLFKLKNAHTRRQLILNFLTGKDELINKSSNNLQNQITLVEYARIAQKYPSIDNKAEMTLISLDFVRMFFSASLIFSYLISYRYLFISLLLLLAQEKLLERLEDTNYGMYLSAVKYINKLNEL